MTDRKGLPKNARRPRESGDPVSFVHMTPPNPTTLDSRFRGNDDLQNPLLPIRLIPLHPLIPQPPQINRLIPPMHHQLRNRSPRSRRVHHPVPGKAGDGVDRLWRCRIWATRSTPQAGVRELTEYHESA
jgi:hypothetical protein